MKLAGAHDGEIIGTTVAVLLIYQEFFACVWAGDSRIYRIRGSGIQQLSVDHTEVQELVAEGKLSAEEARAWPRRNVITRAIGTYDESELEMTNGTLEPGDIFVICSDGLTNHVDDREILALANDNRAAARLRPAGRPDARSRRDRQCDDSGGSLRPSRISRGASATRG